MTFLSSKISTLLFIVIQMVTLFSYSSEPQSNNLNPLQVIEVQKKYNIKVENPDCVGDKEDPFEVGPLLKTGPYKGECFDAESNRPVIVLENQINHLKVANIRFGNQWWIGEFYNDAVEDVLFQIVEFGDPNEYIKMAHTQLRFVFKKNRPLKLSSQVININKTAELTDLIVTFNVFGVNGIGFSTKAARQGAFGLVQKFISSYDRSVEEMLGDHSLVRQFRLNLNSQTKNELFKRAVFNSQTMGYNQNYELLTKNCTTELFNFIDQVIDLPKDVRPFVQSYSPDFIQTYLSILQSPVNSISTYLRIHDLIVQPSLNALEKRQILDREIEPLNVLMKDGKYAKEVVDQFKDTVRKPDHPTRGIRKIVQDKLNLENAE